MIPMAFSNCIRFSNRNLSKFISYKSYFNLAQFTGARNFKKIVPLHKQLSTDTSTLGIPLSKRIKGIRDVKDIDNTANKQTASIPQGNVSEFPPAPLKAIAYCTAEMYDFPKLFKLLKEEYTPLPYLADDVYHLKLTKSDDLESPDCFIFSNGTFVSWGASESQIAHLLALVKNVEMNSYAIETEWFDFYVDQNQPGGMSTDTIVLGSDLSIEQAKFVYSAGITRSVKLGSLENLLEVHLTKNKHIPKTLLLGKHLGISRDQMLRNLGELFQLRAMVNLNSDLLDLPDFCWSSSQMELYFEMISKNLDVRPRIAVFNKKLDYANEIADMIRNHLHEQHSLKLEWAIIILISVEILFSVLHYLETGQF